MLNENIYHVIKDPVHGTMQFTTEEDKWVKPFINSNIFQRLRHIKQLGMGDFVFPGAVHTRFNHCIGCSYIGSQIAHKIKLPHEKRQLVMIACLLHDVGHGPFSHAFEDLFKEKAIRHEDWTPFFLGAFRTPEFFAQYNELNPDFPLSEEKFLAIEEMIMHKSAVKCVTADIVSSQMDADRFDYLLRDSHFCGVMYGQFDFRWMLHCMAIVDSNEGERLGLTHKGIGAVEHYLVARRLMTKNIYHHRKKLALEVLLVKLLQSLAESLESFAPYGEIKSTRLGQFLLAVNQFNTTLSPENRSQQKTNFLKSHYENYKELCDYDIFAAMKSLSNIKTDHTAALIAQRLQNRVMPKILQLDHLNAQKTEEILKNFKYKHKDLFQDWQLTLIRTPHQSYNVDEDPILVRNERGVVKPINELSILINAISDKYENNTFLSIDAAILEDKNILTLMAELS